MTSSGIKFMSNSIAWTKLKHSKVLIPTLLNSTRNSRRSLMPTTLMKKRCQVNGMIDLTHSRRWFSWSLSELIRSPLPFKTSLLKRLVSLSLIHQHSIWVLAMMIHQISLHLFSYFHPVLIQLPISKSTLSKEIWWQELIWYHLDKDKLQKLRKLLREQELLVDGLFFRIAIFPCLGCQDLQPL